MDVDGHAPQGNVHVLPVEAGAEETGGGAGVLRRRRGRGAAQAEAAGGVGPDGDRGVLQRKAIELDAVGPDVGQGGAADQAAGAQQGFVGVAVVAVVDLEAVQHQRHFGVGGPGGDVGPGEGDVEAELVGCFLNGPAMVVLGVVQQAPHDYGQQDQEKADGIKQPAKSFFQHGR